VAPRGRPRASEGDADSRRRQLLRASARLFREKGYDGTSVRDIAQATGLQSGSWVYHFPTKQDILVAVMEQGLEDALARPGADFIPVVLYEWRSLAKEALPRVTAPLKRYEAIWKEAIADLQRTGEWPGRTRIDALLLFGALNWMARWYRADGDLGVDELAREAVKFFLRPQRKGLGDRS
jgi:AcrR family transcriptional regulator